MSYQAPARQEIMVLQSMLGLTSAGSAQKDSTDPVFVCIDCEAFEHDQKKITEIGVAVLDSRDVSGLDPNDRKQWFEKIKYAHYRPQEYAKLVNKRFIQGCAEGFNFGTTIWVTSADVPKVLNRVFTSPSQLAYAAKFDCNITPEARNVVFVGHGANNDDQYLRRLNFSLKADANISRTMDTQRLAGGSKKNGVALWRVARSLDLAPVNLHNAGNDAAYTLQALVAIALKEHASSNSTLVDLARYTGRAAKNPGTRNAVVAPQTWGGTANPPASTTAQKKLIASTAPAPNRERRVVTRDERKRHKREFRDQASSKASEP